MLVLVDDFKHFDSDSDRDGDMREALARVLLAAQEGPWASTAPELAAIAAALDQDMLDQDVADHKKWCMSPPGHCGICNEAELVRLRPGEE